jgi:hypothetical protein
MKILMPSVAELQSKHVVFELECIDRMYLNAYVPKLTSAAGVAGFFRGYLGHRFASTKDAAAMTDRFVTAIRDFLQREDVPLVRFQKGQRKDDVFQQRRKKFEAAEGVVFVGVAQEKARVPRTVRKHFAQGGTIPWIDYTTAMVNVYYFYCVDQDFGPFFIKFCSYFPYTAKLCLNGHEYLKRQLTQRHIGFEALDNGLLSCGDIAAAQRLSDGLTDKKIEAMFRKWLPGCRTLSALKTAKRVTAMTFQSSRRSSPSPRSGTDQSMVGAFSRRSFARTSIWAVPNRCS